MDVQRSGSLETRADHETIFSEAACMSDMKYEDLPSKYKIYLNNGNYHNTLSDFSSRQQYSTNNDSQSRDFAPSEPLLMLGLPLLSKYQPH